MIVSQPIRQSKISDKEWESAQKLIPGGVNSPVRAFRSVGGSPPFISSAKGSSIIDVDGNRVNSSDTLKGSITFSKYAKAGFWYTDQISITDQVGNERHSGVDDFGWKLHLDNPLEDIQAPKYIKDSIITKVENSVLEGQAVQLLNIEWRVDENKKMNDWANCYVSLLPPGGEAYRLQKYGYAIDDGGDGYNTSTKTCRVDFVIPESVSYTHLTLPTKA